MDFTFKTYTQLLQALQSQGYAFITLAGYIKSKNSSSPEAVKSTPGAVEFSPPSGGAGGGAEEASKLQSSSQNRKSDLSAVAEIVNRKLILLRHDVEARYQNARQFAIIQHEMGIRGSYYFRLYRRPRNTRIIRNIVDLGHEIGYHYDDLSYCKGNYEHAIIRFEQHLDFLRTIAPVETITMEGAPLSPYDNRSLWEKFDYKAYGILAEPYFDLNFGTAFNPNRNEEVGNNQTSNKQPATQTSFFYLTDTGRRWDGWRVSLRDKVPQQEAWIRQGLVFRSTNDIIKAANTGNLPDKIMMTFHPQRWNNAPLPWLTELVSQKVKNQVKRVLVAMRGSGASR